VLVLVVLFVGCFIFVAQNIFFLHCFWGHLPFFVAVNGQFKVCQENWVCVTCVYVKFSVGRIVDGLCVVEHFLWWSAWWCVDYIQPPIE